MQVERYYENIKKHCQQLRSLQKKEIKLSITYFPGAFSESKEPDISINKGKPKVSIIPLRTVRETFLSLGNKLSTSKMFQLHMYIYIFVLNIF